MNDNEPLRWVPSHPFAWFPEFLEILRRRSRTQARLLASAILVGIVAGLGAVVFTIACQAVVRVALQDVVGYEAHGPARDRHCQSIPATRPHPARTDSSFLRLIHHCQAA